MPRSCTLSNFHLARCLFFCVFSAFLPSGSLPPLVHPSGHRQVDVTLVPGPDHLGCGARRWDELGEDWLQIWAARGGKFSCWGSHSHSHDPASRHSSSLPPPLPSAPVSCSAPLTFASPLSSHLHVRLLLGAAAFPSVDQQL